MRKGRAMRTYRDGIHKSRSDPFVFHRCGEIYVRYEGTNKEELVRFSSSKMTSGTNIQVRSSSVSSPRRRRSGCRSMNLGGEKREETPTITESKTCLG